ncbi:MAG: adenylate/guanylate cyclase domain-containing protein [Spirochaetales bacterium]|nr:adenylate/guanylate cyclase domain-containing protein [Spirochaetales bacterium]
MGKGKRFFVSINIGISTAFILIIVITSVALSILSFFTVKQAMRTDLVKRMHDILAMGIPAIGGDDLITIDSPAREGTEAYKRIFNSLSYLRENATDVRYAYTMKLNDKGEYAFAVDGDPDPSSRADIGEVYSDATREMEDVFRNRDGIYIESKFAEDEWGVWISGYAPVKTAGGAFAGILGIDISAKTVLDYENQVLLIIMLITAGVIVFGILISMFLSSRITSPLSLLEKDISRIREYRFEDTLNLKTVFREIKSIDNTVDNVKASLRSFQKYVPSDLVKQLIALKKEAVLGGEKRVLTIYFSDIKDSTTFAESMKPEELIKILAKYFSGMTETLINNKATIDKYIGDCIMAFWNAPLDVEKHAYYACEGALATKEFLRNFNRELKERGIMELSTRIGINTGEVIVGNIGYERRFNYTVMGDPANVASRMEGLNKHYGTGILITENTYKEVKDTMATRLIDKVIVKGKTEGLRIYELLASKAKVQPGTLKLIQSFNSAIELYFAKQWKGAAQSFAGILRENPDDMPSKILMARCNGYVQNPPPPDWDGIYVLKSK